MALIFELGTDHVYGEPGTAALSVRAWNPQSCMEQGVTLLFLKARRAYAQHISVLDH